MKIPLTILRALNILIPLIVFLIEYSTLFNVSYSSRGWVEFFALESLTLLILGFIGIRYVLDDFIENKKWVVIITWSFLIICNLILFVWSPWSIIQTLIASALMYAFTLEKDKVNFKIRVISNIVLLTLNLGWVSFAFSIV